MIVKCQPGMVTNPLGVMAKHEDGLEDLSRMVGNPLGVMAKHEDGLEDLSRIVRNPPWLKENKER